VKDVEYLDGTTLGHDLVLSLDLRLQYFAYRELKSAIVSNQAKSGSIVMLDARTGENPGLANQPSFNPNDWRTSRMQRCENRAITTGTNLVPR